MKKKLLLVLLAVMLVLSACGNNDKKDSKSNSGSNDSALLNVVTSFYPIYYMTKQIGGEQVNVVNLIATGVEPHDWTPKSKDLLTASDADLLLYHGVGLETWIDNFVNGLEKDSGVVIKQVSDGIKLIDSDEEEHEHDAEDEAHDHDHDHDAESDDHDHDAEDDGHNHSHDIDPHTWVSPKSARIIAANIKDSLIEVDPDNKSVYESNYEVLEQKLKAIDEQYEQQLANVPLRTIVVSHQSFGYVARDYNLEQIAIMGLSPSAEPRAQDIKNISNLVKDRGVKVIFFEELVSDKLAKMLASEAKVETNVIYSLEGLTTKQEQAEEDYLTLMERNLQNLVEALQ